MAKPGSHHTRYGWSLVLQQCYLGVILEKQTFLVNTIACFFAFGHLPNRVSKQHMACIWSEWIVHWSLCFPGSLCQTFIVNPLALDLPGEHFQHQPEQRLHKQLGPGQCTDDFLQNPP